jgi:unsaturated rhamnogalacturonyl hydrolase
MFTYAMAKGVRMGYLPVSYVKSANAAWSGIQAQFLENKDGGINLLKTIGGAGLEGIRIETVHTITTSEKRS